MINIEPEVFTTVATALRNEFTGIYVSGEYIPAPPRFPAVILAEDDNSTYQRTLDSSGTENHAQLLYTANVYSNKASGAKAECKSIMSVIDAQMTGLGFVRVGCNQAIEVPNVDQSIYRMVARYRTTVSKDNILYRR